MTTALDFTLLPLCQADPKDKSALPGLYAAQAPFRAARGRSSETLVVHLALDGTAPLPPKEHQNLVMGLADTYFKTPGSSTAAMRTVAEQLNDILIERNTRGANRALQSAGLLTLAVFRDQSLYLAQCGPTHSFLITSGGSTHFHLSNLAWRGLGFRRIPNIRYHQMGISPGDRLVIAESPPQDWTKTFLDGLWQVPLEQVCQVLTSGTVADLQAAVIQVGPGTGKLNILQPGVLQEANTDQQFKLEAQDELILDAEDALIEDVHQDEEVVSGDQMPLSPVDLVDEIETVQPAKEAQPTPLESTLDSDELAGEVVIEPGDETQSQAAEFLPEPTADVPPEKIAQIPPWVWGVVGLVLLVGIIMGWVWVSSAIPSSPSETPVALVESPPTSEPLRTPAPGPIEDASPTSESTNTVPASSPTSEPASPTSSPTESPTPEFKSGATQISPVDGMVMVYVPSGDFLMGGMEGDGAARLDEFPPHTVFLHGYWIDQTEVTNAQYAQCVAEGACKSPYSQTSFSRVAYYKDDSFADYPAIFVSWYDATAYCEWAGRRLPTEAEWEKAARGLDARLYPWGEEIDCSLANYGWCSGDTTAVGSYPEGASPYGLLDMAGNVAEWVSDYYYGEYYTISPLDYPAGPESGAYRVIRGGAWNDDIIFLRTSSRYYYFPDNARVSIGFRCVGISSQP